MKVENLILRTLEKVPPHKMNRWRRRLTKKQQIDFDALRDDLYIRLLKCGFRMRELYNDIFLDAINYEAEAITVRTVMVSVKPPCPNCKTELVHRPKFCPSCGLDVREIVRDEINRKRYRTVPVDQGTLTRLKTYISWGGVLPYREKGRIIIDFHESFEKDIYSYIIRRNAAKENRNSLQSERK